MTLSPNSRRDSATGIRAPARVSFIVDLKNDQSVLRLTSLSCVSAPTPRMASVISARS